MDALKHSVKLGNKSDWQLLVELTSTSGTAGAEPVPTADSTIANSGRTESAEPLSMTSGAPPGAGQLDRAAAAAVPHTGGGH